MPRPQPDDGRRHPPPRPIPQGPLHDRPLGMKQQKPILHARDHLPGGADPIPSLTTGQPPPPEPPTTTIPGECGNGPTGSEQWHWWPCRELDDAATPTTIDAGPPTHVTMNFLSGLSSVSNTEMDSGFAGPNSSSASIHRHLEASNDDPAYFGGNYWRGQASVSIPYGVGSSWTLLGWFNFD